MLRFCKEIDLSSLVQQLPCAMKTAKGKGKAKTTKEALKPVDDRSNPLPLCETCSVINDRLWVLRKRFCL